MMWGYGMEWWMWLIMGSGTLAFWLVIVLVIRALLPGRDRTTAGADRPDPLTLLKEGTFAGVIVQNPFNMGYQTVKTLIEAVKGAAPESAKIISPSAWVTKENMDSPEIKQITG